MKPWKKSGLLANLGLDTPQLRAWALYDVANSTFATTIAVAVLPIYFSDVLATDLPQNLRSAYWAYFNSTTMLLTALLAPSLGYLADMRAAKKKFLALFTLIGSLLTIGLAFLSPGNWKMAGLIFVIANVAFNAGVVVYESLLPHIAKDDAVHRVSNSAYALGYLGGGILLAINLLWISKPQLFGLSNAASGVKISFVSVGIVWILFTIPLLRKVKEPKKRGPASSEPKETFSHHLVASLFQLVKTLRKMREYPHMLLFLVAFWAFSDAVGTIINMATIYGREVGIKSEDLTLAILLVQFLGVPASFAFGPITHAIGPKKALNITLVIYMCVSVVALFMTTALHFWILACGVAMVQGANQAISRSIFSSMVPLERSGEFFGLFSVSSKFAGLFGPLVFGLVSSQLGASRYSVLFLIFLFVVGLILFNMVDIDAGVAQAKAENEAFDKANGLHSHH